MKFERKPYQHTQWHILGDQQVIINEFVFFKAVKGGMSEEALVRVCMVAGCPTETEVVTALQRMVDRGSLTITDHPAFGKMYQPNWGELDTLN